MIFGNMSTITIVLLVITLLAAIYGLILKNAYLLAFLAIVATILVGVPTLFTGASSNDTQNNPLGEEAAIEENDGGAPTELEEAPENWNVPEEVDEPEEIIAHYYPDDAMYYNGHHYYIYDEDGTDWSDAEANCLELGGYLAVINDGDENEALFEYMVDKGFETAFFGLTYIDGSWVYLDGDTSVFRNWGINYRGKQQPNNYEKGDIHVALDIHMTNGRWNDVRYGRTDAYVANGSKYKNLHTYICEWDE